MGEIRLTTPRLRVVREGHDDLELQSTNADLVRWDRTRARHKWPNPQEAPFLWLTFTSWSAARRTGAIPDSHTYEAWEAEVLEVESLNTSDDDEDEEGSPTNGGVGLG
jgi:hypothetical protein